MPSAVLPSAGNLTPTERRRQVAAILARGVVRHRRIAELAQVGEFSPPRDTGLELVPKTRLSVSKGLARETRAPDCEVNDEQNA